MNPLPMLLVPLVIGVGLLGVFLRSRFTAWRHSRTRRAQGMRTVGDSFMVVRGSPMYVNGLKMVHLRSSSMTFDAKEYDTFSDGPEPQMRAVVRADIVCPLGGGSCDHMMELFFNRRGAEVIIPMGAALYKMAKGLVTAAKVSTDLEAGMASGIFEITGHITRFEPQFEEAVAVAHAVQREHSSLAPSTSPIPA